MKAQSEKQVAKNTKQKSAGTMTKEIRSLHASLNLYGRQKTLSASEAEDLKRLLELHACREEWDRVVDLASQGIVLGGRVANETWFYRAWIEGLKEDLDVEGLSNLGRHLIARRTERVEYLALAVHAFTYAGQPAVVRSALQQLYRTEAGGQEVQDAFAVSRLESISREERMLGLRILASGLKTPCCGYFSYRAFLSYAFENGALATAASTLKSINGKFPESPEPYFVSALLSVNEGKWIEAIASLDIVLRQNCTHGDAILLKSRCMDMIGETAQSRFFLLENASNFVHGDYEFNVQLGLMERDLFRLSPSDSMLRASASSHLMMALKAARAYGFAEAPITAALKDLGVSFGKEDTDHAQKYWLMSLDAKLLVQVLESGDFHLRCPPIVKKNDVIFFAAEDRKLERGAIGVSGFLKVVSSATSDAALGFTAHVANAVVFENDITVAQDGGIYRAVDGFGQENFAKISVARFFEVDESIADEIVSKVDESHRPIRMVG
jgi:hypothetical protein